MIYSDIDIQFFKPTRSIIEQSIEKHEIAFQPRFPHREINTGFIAMHCNASTLRLWQEVLDVNRQRPTESQQPLTYQLLCEGFPIRWTRFPREIWHWNHGGRWGNIALHHATGEPELEYKTYQMEVVR